MIMQIFTIYDSKAEAYLPPFYCPNTAVAIRSFATCADDPEHAFCKNPGDYTLFRLGDWDDQTSNFEITEAKQTLGTALEQQTVQNLDNIKSAFAIKGGE